MVMNLELDLGHIAEPLRHLAIPIDNLTPDPRNVRLHPTKNMEAIKASLARFGQRTPIIVQKQGMVVRAGNGRLEAARALGWTHIAAMVVDEADSDAIAYGIADNRTAELAQWDKDGLAKILEELKIDQKYNQLSIGFNKVEIKNLVSSLKKDIEAIKLQMQFYVTVQVESEQLQKELFEEMTGRGMKCRLAIF